MASPLKSWTAGPTFIPYFVPSLPLVPALRRTPHIFTRSRFTLPIHRSVHLPKESPRFRACAEPIHSDPVSPPTTPPSNVSTLINTATNLFPLWVLSGAVIAFVHPPSFLWFKSALIVPTLALIMLGMGLTISPSSFAGLSRTPLPVLIGVLSQYTLMPLLATAISYLLALPPHIAVGVILVGVCPGGAASNIVCLLAGANVPLSVVLTLVSTIFSIGLIPFLMKALAGTIVPVNPLALLMSTAQVVLLPLLLGAVINRVWPRAVKTVMNVLPLISVIGVSLICAGVVAANASALLSVGPRLILAIASMHTLGGLFGYFIASIFRFSKDSRRTISIEVMMQNSSLAVSLANAHFANPVTAVPGAISATMHSIFGSLLAALWRFSDARKTKQLAKTITYKYDRASKP